MRVEERENVEGDRPTCLPSFNDPYDDSLSIVHLISYAFFMCDSNEKLNQRSKLKISRKK